MKLTWKDIQEFVRTISIEDMFIILGVLGILGCIAAIPIEYSRSYKGVVTEMFYTPANSVYECQFVDTHRSAPVFQMNPATGMMEFHRMETVYEQYVPESFAVRIQTVNKKGKTVFRYIPVSHEIWKHKNVGDSIYVGHKYKNNGNK